MARNVKAPLAAWLACTGGLVLLAMLAYGSAPVQRFDATVLAKFVADTGSQAESLAAGLTPLGDPLALLLLLALACGIGLMRGRPRDAAAALAVVAGANLTTQMLKVLFSHPRVRSILGADQIAWDGFPSGHTTAAASIVIAFLFVMPRNLRPLVAALGTCFAAAMGCSVLVLGWHYPSDVLGGILVASSWGFAVLAAQRFAVEAGSRRAAQLPRRAAISVK